VDESEYPRLPPDILSVCVEEYCVGPLYCGIRFVLVLVVVSAALVVVGVHDFLWTLGLVPQHSWCLSRSLAEPKSEPHFPHW